MSVDARAMFGLAVEAAQILPDPTWCKQSWHVLASNKIHKVILYLHGVVIAKLDKFLCVTLLE